MLKLIKNEFRKLKRKHFISFVFIAALLFPIPFTALVLSGNIANYSGFDAIFGLLVTLGEPVMLPIVLGIVASMLFFMEYDNDTLKNLQVVPILPIKLATAKIAVLFILGLVFALATLLSSMVGGIIAGNELTNIGGKIWISAVTALLYTASTLPVVIVIVWLNKSYIFSIIVTFFYTVFDYMMAYTGQFASDNQAIKKKLEARGVIVMAAAIGGDKDMIERIYREGYLNISDLETLTVVLARELWKRILR